MDEIFGGDVAGCGVSSDGTLHHMVKLMTSSKWHGIKIAGDLWMYRKSKGTWDKHEIEDSSGIVKTCRLRNGERST